MAARLEAAPRPLSPASSGRRRRRGFVARTLADLAGALESSVLADETASRPGLLQRLDARVKLIGLLAFIVAAGFARGYPPLLALHALSLGLAVASGLSAGYFLRRVWVFIPAFTGLVALPAVFNLLTPGPAALVLLEPLSLGPLRLADGLSLTWPGLRVASLLILRVGTSVSFAVLLVLTTRWTSLLSALRVLKVPAAFVLVLAMTHRYVYVLLHVVNNALLARESRAVGRLTGAQNRRWLGATIGALLGKSYHLSDEVYLAMLSRGFRGEVRGMPSPPLARLDYAWLGLALPLAAAFVAVEVMLGA